MASPDFRINGSAVGVPVYVAASAAISATLDSTDGVRQVLWYVESTDETTMPANYTLVQSGSVGQTVTTTALTAGTAAQLRCRINNGVNLSTGLNDPDGTEATGKFGVLSAGGYAVGCVNETIESDGVFGWAKLLNPIIRAMPSAPITSVSVTSPILNSGTATAPIIALDYTEAATASKVPIRSASGELKAVAFQASTSTFEHNRLAFDSAVTGTIINSAGPITTDSATSQIRKIGGVTSETLTATSLNIPTGSTFAVNGVGHATAATNSSLAFRGTAGELSVARLYSTGTVHTTAWLSYARNGILLGCKTGGGVDHSVITEDGAAGFVYGDATSTAKHTFICDTLEMLVLDSSGGSTIGNASGGGITMRFDGGESFLIISGGVTALDVSANSASVFNSLSLSTNRIGFFGTGHTTKPTITGSRAGNAALASLLTGLAGLGLITDSTTA